MAKDPAILWYLIVNDTNIRVRVIRIVVHYTHSAVSVVPKPGAIHGVVIDNPWSVDVR